MPAYPLREPSVDMPAAGRLELVGSPSAGDELGGLGYPPLMPDLRRLPSVDALARRLLTSPSCDLPQAVVIEIARRNIEAARSAALDGRDIDPDEMAQFEVRRLSSTRIDRVVNATGVILHTNLGRAPLHASAAAAARRAALGYTNLEFDLTEGARGGRGRYLTELLTHLTGAGAAMAVNNNAAALFLTLHTLAGDGSVPVSRGELIEIGGSYRLPELMAASGTRLLEVGTTNRTRIADYRQAIQEDTRLLLKVHPSNYRVVGFCEEVSVRDLVSLAHTHHLPVVYDVGSGLVDRETPWLGGPPPRWIGDEPGVRQVLADGADLVTFSGDKLFGGCQAGIIAGRPDLVAGLKASPVARAMRLDGSSLAALSRTCELYAEGRGAEIPFWRKVNYPVDDLESRLQRLADQAGVARDIRQSESMVGAGSVPGMTVPTPVLALPDGEGLWDGLLRGNPPVVARRSAGELLVDLRAVDSDDDVLIAASLRELCRS